VELEQLQRTQQLAGTGHGQVAAIVGEAGAGKSSPAPHELQKRAVGGLSCWQLRHRITGARSRRENRHFHGTRYAELLLAVRGPGRVAVAPADLALP